MPRKPNHVAELVDSAPLPEQQITASQNLMARVEQEFTAEAREATYLIGQRIGRRQVFDSLIKLLSVTDIQDLSRIKESKQYKGFQHVGTDGRLVTITGWYDYCSLVESRSRETIDVEILNLERLGPECFEVLRAAGIGAGRMRNLRGLPQDELTALMAAAKDADKETVLDLAEELIVKQKLDKQKLQDELQEARADLDAKEQRITKLSDDLNKEHEKLAKAQRKWKSATPDERLQILQHSVTDAETAIVAMLGTAKDGLRNAVMALADHCDENSIDNTAFLGDVFGRLLNSVRAVRDDEQIATHIPIVSDAGEDA